MEIIDVKKFELLKNEEYEKWFKKIGRKYYYSLFDSYNTILKNNNQIEFLSLKDIFGSFDRYSNEEKYGEYKYVDRYVPPTTEEYYWDGELRRCTNDGYTTSESKYFYYSRNELIEKYYNKEKDDKKLKTYLKAMSENMKSQLENNLLDYLYILFISNYPFEIDLRKKEDKYLVHNKYDWEDIHKWIDKTYRYENAIKMRNIFVKTAKDNNLNFSQTIILSILFPDLIVSENYSKIVLTEDDNISILNFKDLGEIRRYDNQEESLKNYTVVIASDLISRIKDLFDESYIFDLASVEAYALKSKFEIFINHDLISEYPNIGKHNLLKLILYTKDYDELKKYLELIKRETSEIQEKIIKVIEPYSSMKSIKTEYNSDELYNAIKFVNVIKFLRSYKIGFNYEEILEDYKAELSNIDRQKKEDLGYIEKRISASTLSRLLINNKNKISSPIKVCGTDFNIGIKTDILSMNPYFVDTFETYFKDKIEDYRVILKLDDKEKILDEILLSKNDILKYAYTEPFVSESDYDKMLVAKSFLDKYFEYRFPKSMSKPNKENRVEENNSKRLIKNLK